MRFIFETGLWGVEGNVQDHVGTASQGAIAPGLEFGIKFGGGADLRGTDGMPPEFLDDFGNFAGRTESVAEIDCHRQARRGEGKRIKRLGHTSRPERA